MNFAGTSARTRTLIGALIGTLLNARLGFLFDALLNTLNGSLLGTLLDGFGLDCLGLWSSDFSLDDDGCGRGVGFGTTSEGALEELVSLAVDRAEVVRDFDLTLLEEIDEHLAVLVELFRELENPVLRFRRFRHCSTPYVFWIKIFG